MPTSTIPVTFDVDAQVRLDKFGCHREFEQMIEHAAEAIPDLKKIVVTAPYNEVLGPDQQIVIEAYVPDARSLAPEREFNFWVFENIPREAATRFVFMTVEG